MSADPTEAGSTANEGGYAAYERAQTDRSTQGSSPYGWAPTSGNATVTPAGVVVFPQCSSASAIVLTHFMVFPSSGAQATSGLYVGTLSPTIALGAGVTPRITTSSSITED